MGLIKHQSIPGHEDVGMFEVIAVKSLLDNYIWLIVPPKPHGLIVIDPGESQGVLDYCKRHGRTLAAILITHHHGDHTQGIGPLVHAYPCKVFGPALTPIQGVTHRIKANDQIVLTSPNLMFKVLGLPGHTLDHVGYHCGPHLFCGDTLFSSGCGRLLEGQAQDLLSSLKRINGLPQDTYLYPAHEYTLNNLHFAQQVEPLNKALWTREVEVIERLRENKPSLPTTLKIERQCNPFLRLQTVKAQLESLLNLRLDTELTIFKILRRLKDQWPGKQPMSGR